MELAWRIAGYLEDVVNQIGIFKALTIKNQEIFGTPIPLFVMNPEHFSPDTINKKALTYLVWDFFTETRENLILSSTHDDLQTIAEEIYGYLKKKRKNITWKMEPHLWIGRSLSWNVQTQQPFMWLAEG